MRYIESLLLLVAVLLIIPCTSAFDIDVSPVNQSSHRIFFDEVAQFTLTIENNAENPVVYSISSNPVEWVMESDSSIKVDAGKTEKIIVKLRPRPSNFRGPGMHSVPIHVASSEKTKSLQVAVYIKSIQEGYGQYTPAVSIGASMGDLIDPREQAKVQISVRNRNILDIKDLKLIVDGDIFYKEEIIELNPLGERVFQYRFDIDPLLSPENYNLNVRVFYQNKTLAEVKNSFDIAPYSKIERSNPQEASKFFKVVKINTLKNNGNVEKIQDFTVPVVWYMYLFTDVVVEATNVQHTGNDWTVILGPQEVASISVTENYRPLIFVAGTLIIAILTYFLFRSSVVIQKQIIVTGRDEEGISEMKVRIYVKNRSDKGFYNLRVIDKAPTIATVKTQGGLGVLEPTKIVPTEKKGTLVKWDIDTLEAYEERIFTYTLKARLKIIGNISLPRVRAKFENVKGKETTVESSKAVIGAKV